ncbi:HD domain-containing protein [Maribellus maritimus]|uniref:HD domain-containing protein n=1 Tax=Maribellus maritimus TaxID=2870838 RepID=UPI001EEC07BA|nr:HD domain-containing protein [Maribellus maritimus]MCG6190829.1 HD domain-containing protein [Maribellus maritimus]
MTWRFSSYQIFLLLPCIFSEDIMNEDGVNLSIKFLNSYIESFKDLREEQENNFVIKQNHSKRVAENALGLSEKLELPEKDKRLAFIIAMFHDIGRFPQLVQYNTFNDSKSVDHAELGVEVLKKERIPEQLGCGEENVIYSAILAHNKFEIPKKLSEQELLHAKILRDADKLDILKVLTDYYSNRNAAPNHTLTWELPKSAWVSDAVAKEILAGKLVSKKNVASELDVKIMQMSWIFDLNFKASVEYVLEKRYLEKIYESTSKSDRIIDIYRKVKVFAENKMMK